jgi:hypothetical protein
MMLYVFHTETQEYIIGVFMALVTLGLLWLPKAGARAVEAEPVPA